MEPAPAASGSVRRGVRRPRSRPFHAANMARSGGTSLSIIRSLTLSVFFTTVGEFFFPARYGQVIETFLRQYFCCVIV